MSFANITFNKLVKKYSGWTEKGIARFPSPYLKEQFLKEMEAHKASKTKLPAKQA
jgi:hypothetical protein